MNSLRDKVVFVSGANRAIGREVALRCAREGAKLAITGKAAAK